MGCMLSAASCNNWWMSDILGTSDFAKEQGGIHELGKNKVFFLPYLMGERSPLNDTDARGTFTGLRMDTSRADMVQAVLEGVAFAVRDNVEIAKGQGIDITGSTLCGGGAASELWQKILCNVLNIPLEIPQTEQGPGYGGALLAMVGTGRFATVRECGEHFRKIRKTIRPDSAIAARYEAQYRKFSKIYPAMRELFKNLRNEE
jgi:xylulokinase